MPITFPWSVHHLQVPTSIVSIHSDLLISSRKATQHPDSPFCHDYKLISKLSSYVTRKGNLLSHGNNHACIQDPFPSFLLAPHTIFVYLQPLSASILVSSPQLMSTNGVGTNSMPTGISNLGCSDKRGFIQSTHLNCDRAWLRNRSTIIITQL